MGQTVPPPYQDNSTAWSQQPSQGYPPQPQGYGVSPYPNQGPGYGQQTYQGQTVIVVPTPLENPVKDYLGYSIFTTFCCCMPVGIAALIYSVLARGANRHGDQVEAERTSRKAKTLNHVALGLGIGAIIIIVVCRVLLASMNDH